MTTSRALLLVLVLLLLAGGVYLCVPTQYGLVVYYVSPEGTDSRTCSQATSASTAKRSINAGISCLAGGNILEMAPGLYPEWLLTSLDGSQTVEKRYTDVQPGTAIIPSGTSSQPTVLRAGPGEGQVILSPTTKNPETGAILSSIGAYARFIVVEGLHLKKAGGRDERTQGSGVYLADSQDITLRGGSVYRGTIKSSIGSQRLTVEGMEIGYSGEGCDFTEGDPNTGGQPCPHGLYLCGTNHVIRSNYIHHFAHTGAQVSCEQGSSSATIYGNRIAVGPGPAVSIKGSGAVIANNIEGTGVGIRWYGNVTVANNMVRSYYKNNQWVPDPFQLIYDGGGTAINNMLYEAKSSFNMIANQQFKPIDTQAIRNNVCDRAGNAGCTNVQPPEAVFVDYAQKDYTLKAGSPAVKAGLANPAVTVDIRRTPYPTPAPDLGARSSQSATPPPDTTKPTVRITNPPNNEQVFGPSLPLVATASDNVGVTQVIFQIDGAAVGEPVTTVPYQVIWDTTTVGNGPHALTAVAKDAANNQSVASITLRVENPVAPEPPPGEPILACSGTLKGEALAFSCTKQEGQR